MRIGINTSMNTVFFLARHGETQWNKLKKLQEDYRERLFPFAIKNINKLKKYIKYIPQNTNHTLTKI